MHAEGCTGDAMRTDRYPRQGRGGLSASASRPANYARKVKLTLRREVALLRVNIAFHSLHVLALMYICMQYKYFFVLYDCQCAKFPSKLMFIPGLAQQRVRPQLSRKPKLLQHQWTIKPGFCRNGKPFASRRCTGARVPLKEDSPRLTVRATG